MTVYAATVVPAIPPRPPQVTLIGSAVTPGTGADPNFSYPTGDQLAMLPDELAAELAALKGDIWVRGFTYAPENHGAAWTRDPCDFTSYDYPAYPAPTGLALQHVAGGTVPNETVSYQVTALNANGETTSLAAVTLATGAIGSVKLTWNKTADDATYNVYGRVGGAIGFLATVGPFDADVVPTYTDTGSIAPGAAPPISNTTAGIGVYTNPAIVTYTPFLIEAMDKCSSFGWSERDFKGRATRWVENATPRAVEYEFWTGALATAKGYPNNYLANSNDPVFQDLTPLGGPPSVARGMQILQDGLQQAGFGGQGMIHVQAQTAPNLLGARRVGRQLLDVFDNIVVPGVGYPGTGKLNAAPTAGCAWMFATDLVCVRIEPEVRIFPDTFSEALDRGQTSEPNTITFRGERFAAAYWDGAVHLGCQVTLAT